MIDWEAFLAGVFGGVLVGGALVVIGIGLVRTFLRVDDEIQRPFDEYKARENE